jgi:hypothetical protein
MLKRQKMYRFLILVLLFGFISCKHNDSNSLPTDLNEAIGYFDNKWTKKEKLDFIHDSLKNAHFSSGRWIRDNWIHGERDTVLVKYFNQLGIYHPDDISSIILTSLYRKLTNKPIDLDGQIKKYKDYWQPIMDCEARERKKACDNFQKLKIGSQIIIYMEVDTSNGSESVVISDCPNPDWTFDSNKDLKLTGLVTDKYHINDSMNVFIKVKILKMNKDSISGILNANKVGVIEDLSMEFLRFEIIK